MSWESCELRVVSRQPITEPSPRHSLSLQAHICLVFLGTHCHSLTTNSSFMTQQYYLFFLFPCITYTSILLHPLSNCHPFYAGVWFAEVDMRLRVQCSPLFPPSLPIYYIITFSLVAIPSILMFDLQRLVCI